MILAKEQVEAKTFSYPVILGEDLEGLSEELSRLPKVSKFFLITERDIASLYQKYLEKELRDLGIPVHFIYIRGGEKNKHIDRLKKLYEELIEEGADRHSVILAFGGGVVGDLAGFVASTFQRGIRFVQIPTTLLACVDSSVGGKVAVNVNKGKNMVGSFYQPELVFAPFFALSTLPEKEWRCGFAEVAKHSFLAGGDFLSQLSPMKQKDIMESKDKLSFVISESVKLKASIVSQDEKESGLRAVLNLGHTTGHAIESVTKYKKYSHGEAVAKGLLTSLLLSKRLMGFPSEKISLGISILRNLGLSLKIKEKPSEILEHMYADKKKEGDHLKFVLLKDFGKPEFGVTVEPKLILDVLKEQKLMDNL